MPDIKSNKKDGPMEGDHHAKSGRMLRRRKRHRPAADVHLLAHSQRAAGNSLDLLCTELGNNRAPLAYSGGTDAERPGDIRGFLKVVENVGFEHGRSLSPLNSRMQAHLMRTALTLVDMDTPSDLAGRLRSAMKDADVKPSALAHECQISAAAVTKWLNGDTKKLSAANYAAAARALGVRDEWLRTGKLPRERDAANMQMEGLQAAMSGLREPLAALLAIIDEFSGAQKPAKKRGNLS